MSWPRMTAAGSLAASLLLAAAGEAEASMSEARRLSWIINLMAPMTIDKSVRLIETDVSEGAFALTLEIDRASFAGFGVAEARRHLRSRLCANEHMRGLIESGVPMKPTLIDRSGAQLGETVVEPGVC